MNIQLGAVLIFVMIAQILGWRPFKVELPKYSYELLQPETMDFNMTIKNATSVDAYINILKDIYTPFVDLSVVHDSGNGTYDMVLSNKTIDLCMFLNNRKLNIFFDIIYRTFADYGDLPRKCPIRKKRYDLRNVIMDPEKFPPFMPDHKARVSGALWCRQHGKKYILLKISFDVVMERSFKNNGRG